MIKLFTNIYYGIKKWRKLFFLLTSLVIGLFIYFSFQIQLEEDITKILPKGKSNNVTAKVLDQLNFSDKITVMIKTDNPENYSSLSAVATVFLDSLQQDSLYYKEVQGRVSGQAIQETFSFVYNHIPLFLNAQDYKEIEKSLGKDSIHQQIKNDYKTLISPTGMIARDFILKDPLGFSFRGLKKLRELGISKDFILKDGFVTTADSSTLVLFITPTFSGTDTKRNEVFVEHLYHYQDVINQANNKEVKITYFGAPFISLANANQIKHDIKTTVLIALVILMSILILFYKQIYVPLILFIPAICGASTALTYLYFTHDSISAISISIGAILIGITVDYPLHVITHFRESSDVKLLFKNITKPVLASSMTTAAAFFCLVFVNSPVLQDLGVFAGITILISAFCALILVPHLYIPKTATKKTIIDKFAAHKFEKNYVIIGVTVIALLLGVFSFSKVKFDPNIAHLNYIPKNLKASKAQFENLGSIGGKSIYLSVYGDSLSTVLHQNSQVTQQLEGLKTKGVIQDYTSIGGVVLSKKNQQKKVEKWNHFWQKHSKDSVIYYVRQAALSLGFKENAFQGLKKILQKDYQPISMATYKKLKPLQLEQFFTHKKGFYTISSIVKTDSIHRLATIQSLEGEHVLPVDRKHMSQKFLGQIRDDFKDVMKYSFIAVFLILLFFFRRIELAILGIIPIVLTGFVTTTIIYFFGLQLNIFSTIVTTLIIGLGVDFSVFMSYGLRKRYTNGKDELTTYRTSIILAVLTTILTLGVLIFAKHPALKSVSAIALIGILSAMFITFTFYPIIFKFFIENRPKKGKSPVSLRLLIFSILSFLYFGVGSLFLSFFGTIILRLLPISKKKKERMFRKLISKFVRSVMYSNYGSKNKISNPHNEKLEEPAIIIANHSSFLDTLAMGFLKKPFISLVNDWVYNSPIFGKAIRSAGYYPVSAGIKNGEKQIVKTMEEGYLLTVFPEGTRSTTGAIGRFHKGAFLLAQKYNIDIVPVYIHGISDLLPKSDFIIFDGTSYLEIGKRIKFSDKKEESIREVTKEISSNFKKKHREIRKEREDENYFKTKIFLNFLYKTDDIVKEAHREFNANKSLYYQLNSVIGEQDKILRIGNDFGIWDLMLTFQAQKRKVFSYIPKEEKRMVAKESYGTKKYNISYPDNLNFISASPSPLETLFITTEVEEELLFTFLKQQAFQNIIGLTDRIRPEVFLSFGYLIETKNSNYFILKSS